MLVAGAAMFASACSSPADQVASSANTKTPPTTAQAPTDASTFGGSVAAAPPAQMLAPDLPPLPAGLNTAARPAEVVRTVYEFAARHPEVLHYVPCFCGCERGGHKDNEDCFVASRDKAGKVTAWESHGMICEICIDVAQQAMQMHNAGASVAEIRTAIELKYAAMSQERHTHTPTPPAPRGGHDR